MIGTESSAGGRQPEALETFEAAAREGGEKPREQGLTATAQTAPKSDDPDRKAKAAADVLKAGVDKDPKTMTDVVQQSKDPRIP